MCGRYRGQMPPPAGPLLEQTLSQTGIPKEWFPVLCAPCCSQYKNAPSHGLLQVRWITHCAAQTGGGAKRSRGPAKTPDDMVHSRDLGLGWSQAGPFQRPLRSPSASGRHSMESGHCIILTQKLCTVHKLPAGCFCILLCLDNFFTLLSVKFHLVFPLVFFYYK